MNPSVSVNVITNINLYSNISFKDDNTYNIGSNTKTIKSQIAHAKTHGLGTSSGIFESIYLKIMFIYFFGTYKMKIHIANQHNLASR